MEQMSQLVKQRGRIRAKLTKFKTFIARLNEEPNKRTELISRLEKAEQLWTEFDDIQNQIEDLDESSDQETERSNFEDSFHEIISNARKMSITEQTPAPQIAQVDAPPIVQLPVAQGEQFVMRPTVKLPNIDLPKFDGTYERWIPFRDLFDSLIASNTALPNVQKLHYLRSALLGEAAKVINSLEITNDNYALAWSLLKKRYENKRLIVQHLIQMLIDMPAITKESHADLRQLADNISQYTKSLAKLDQPVDSWSTIIIHIILPKIDKNSRREWELKRSVLEAFPTLTEFTDYLIIRSAFLEAVNQANQISQHSVYHNRRDNKPSVSQHKNLTQSYVVSSDLSCVTCSGNHGLQECQVFRKMTVKDRLSEVKRKRLCIKCLRTFHGRNCKSNNCKTCKSHHNTLLHRTDNTANERQEGQSSNINQTSQVAIASNSNEATVLSHCSVRGITQVILATAIIYIRDHNGTPHECRALLDSGSQSNFVTKELSEKLRLKREFIDTNIMGISNTSINAVQRIHATIESRINSCQFEVPFLVINQITERLPMIKLDETHLNIPSNLALADPNYSIPGRIDVLLGASIFWELMCCRQIRQSKNEPILQETLLGWIISGPMHIGNVKQQDQNSYCGISLNNMLQQQLEKFWKLEEVELPIQRSNEETQCEEHFLSTYRRNEEGRFVVQLPLKNEAEELGESYHIVEGRLKTLERKLEKQPELKENYHAFMMEYLTLGHMTEIRIGDKHDRPMYYIPHHAVMKEESTTTKVRVVFDASCKTTSGRSLNNILLVGPIIQDNLFDIIIRLRQHKYAMTADVTKMYRQVLIHKEDRKLQCILWRWDSREPIRTFELNTITYGMSSSPFLAIRCMQEAAQQMRHKYETASEIIKRDFYVDDLLTGADTVDALIQLKQDISSILKSAKFELRKWTSNTSEICDHESSQEKVIRPDESTKILGLWWNTTTDNFQYHIKLNPHDKVTKRNILANVAQIYDPLGVLGPIIIQVKILIQRLWQLKCSWDEEITTEIKDTWNLSKIWRSKICNVEQLSIPRRILCDNPVKIEVHGFCDASEAAYGACIYLRTIENTSNTKYTVRLLCAKSRVAPVKKLSLPRLELCGALLLAKLSRKVLQILTVQIHEVYLWSDSTIVLSWIAREATEWKTFVANRVGEIQRETRNARWYHVRSEDNPADLLSRGVNPERLKDRKIWWEGPQFLHQGSKFTPFNKDNQMIMIEKRTISLNVQINEKEAFANIIEKFSSLSRLRRVIAYCLRFKNKNKHKVRGAKLLTVEEIEQAMKILIKGCQRYSFVQELQDLRNHSQVHSKSKLVMLHPFLDEEGIIRVGGRLCNAPVEYTQKHPIILPKKHHITKLIIRDIHYKNLHAGPQAVLTMIRSNYWPISGKDAVRSVLRHCIVCFRAKPVIAKQLMGNLPAIRVTQSSRAFLYSGVDYAGPFTIKISRNKTSKAYLSIFVCLVTKAVHFELVPDLNTTSFLNALKRFIARRGRCKILYSDNGTTFVGANNQLKELKDCLLKEETQSQIQEYLTEQFIEWKFIPPYSPHIGGLWEAGVKSAKTHMRKIIGTTPMSFEELYTVLISIEACLNSRPLTPLSNDPSDLQPLTPGHFLIGEALTAIPEQNVTDVPTNRLTRYQLITQMKQNFWTRWSTEYIAQLQQRGKWKQSSSVNIKPGIMVILKNENTPPMAWPLGRVVEIHPGTDGITRIVTVKTSRGLCKRAIAKICILPIEKTETI